MSASFFLSSTCSFAQLSKPLSGTPYGKSLQSTITSYALSQAMPMAKSLIGTKIVVTGAAATTTASSNTGSWFLLTDGTVKVPVIKKITATVPAIANGQKLGLYFGYFYTESLPSMN
jgi:hypothetical protein